jgi:hypothetical protein
MSMDYSYDNINYIYLTESAEVAVICEEYVLSRYFTDKIARNEMLTFEDFIGFKYDDRILNFNTFTIKKLTINKIQRPVYEYIFNVFTKTQSRKNQIQEINCMYSISLRPSKSFKYSNALHLTPTFQVSSKCLDTIPFSVSLRIHLPCKTNQNLPDCLRNVYFWRRGGVDFPFCLFWKKYYYITGK